MREWTEPCIDGIECEGMDGAPDKECTCIDGKEQEGDKQTKVSGETILFEHKYLFGEVKLKTLADTCTLEKRWPKLTE